jgi:hypothetical protein
MYKLKTDLEKNRLTLTLTGFITEGEALTVKEAIVREIPNLSPGFDVINDISNFRLGQDQAGKVLQEIIHLFLSSKVNRVVRVVGASQTGLIQFANYTGEIGSYNVKYVPTFKDAEIFLETK